MVKNFLNYRAVKRVTKIMMQRMMTMLDQKIDRQINLSLLLFFIVLFCLQTIFLRFSPDMKVILNLKLSRN